MQLLLWWARYHATKASRNAVQHWTSPKLPRGQLPKIPARGRGGSLCSLACRDFVFCAEPLAFPADESAREFDREGVHQEVFFEAEFSREPLDAQLDGGCLALDDCAPRLQHFGFFKLLGHFATSQISSSRAARR